jgi:hypothetical protein
MPQNVFVLTLSDIRLTMRAGSKQGQSLGDGAAEKLMNYITDFFRAYQERLLLLLLRGLRRSRRRC